MLFATIKPKEFEQFKEKQLKIDLQEQNRLDPNKLKISMDLMQKLK